MYIYIRSNIYIYIYIYLYLYLYIYTYIHKSKLSNIVSNNHSRRSSAELADSRFEAESARRVAGSHAAEAADGAQAAITTPPATALVDRTK